MIGLYFGVVEDRNDPKQMGRVRVRFFGVHSDDRLKVPINALPWATVLMPNTSPSTSGVGSNSFLVEGSWVVGSFIDTKTMQDPIVLGTINGLPESKLNQDKGFSDPTGNFPKFTGEPDVNRLARGTNTIENELDEIEPESPYAPQYPKNHVYETEAGHVVEFDDTEGAERIRIYHKAGTFDEIHPDGSRVEKTKVNKYEIILGEDSIHVHGNCTLKVDGNVIVDSAHIELGKGSTEKLILGNTFMKFFNEHTHQTGVGPTSVVQTPMTESEHLSQQDNTTL